MSESTAVRYFRKVFDLLERVEVTDNSGKMVALDQGAERGAKEILSVRSARGKIMLVGNGGSAAVASHLSTDLCMRVGVRSIVFTDTPTLTALSNDRGYSTAFEFQVERWASEGDVLIAISSSGRSDNILRAVRAARDAGCRVITLSGFRSDNPLRLVGDINFFVSSEEYGEVEVSHSTLAHFLSDRAEQIGAEDCGREARK